MTTTETTEPTPSRNPKAAAINDAVVLLTKLSALFREGEDTASPAVVAMLDRITDERNAVEALLAPARAG